MQNAIFEGIISHRRFKPISHTFSYPIFMVCINLDESDTFFSQSRFWSKEKFNWASFRRTDYLNPSVPNLKEAVQKEIKVQLDESFDGKVYLLTHFRYLGLCFNPVSFYFCYRDESLEYIIAEVNNTPWNQRHSYVLKCSQESTIQEFNFKKRFHVSPFNPMDMEYQWRFDTTDSHIKINMQNLKSDSKHFQADMLLQEHEASKKNLNSILLRYPAVTLKTVAAIYWQALKLKLKGAIFFDNPKSSKENLYGNFSDH